jgi:hypothetical protein
MGLIMVMDVFWNVALCSLISMFSDILEELTVFIIRAVTLMMEAVSTSETSVNIYHRVQGATSQKTAIFKLVINTEVMSEHMTRRSCRGICLAVSVETSVFSYPPIMW